MYRVAVLVKLKYMERCIHNIIWIIAMVPIPYRGVGKHMSRFGGEAKAAM